MKQYLALLFIAVAISSNIFAQDDDRPLQNIPTIGSHEGFIGSYVNNGPIKCRQYELPYNAYTYYIDTERREIILLLRNGKSSDGYVAVYDINASAFKWQKDISSFRIVYGKDNLILVRGQRAICLDRNTGQQKWAQGMSNVKYIDDRNGIALTDSCNALDLETGKVLWTRRLPGLANWDELAYLNDTTIVLICDGLRSINLKTGKGYNLKYKTQIGKKALTPGQTAVLVIGVQFGIVGGITAGFLVGNSTAPAKVSSTMIMEDGNMFVTAKNKVLCINGTADKILWEGKLPSNITADFTFFTHGDKVILISEGIARNSEGIKSKVSQSFFAAFRKSDGEKVFSLMVDEDGNDFYSDHKVSNDTLSLLFTNTIYQYNINTGKKLVQKRNDLKPYADYTSFINTDNVYIHAPDSSYKRNEMLNEKNFVVNTNKSRAVIYTSALIELGDIEKKDITVKYGTWGNIDLLRSGDRTIMVKDGEKFGELNTTQKGWLYAGKLYIIEEGKLNVVDLASLHPH